MADKIQATPPKGGQWMLKLAEVLRGAAERAAPALDLPGLPLFGETYRSLARGVENWAYGDSPIDTRANTPLVNERTADMAGALPIGAAGNAAAAAKASLLIPIIRGRNADKLAEANLIKRAELADALKAQGATPGDIWHDAQVSEVLRPTNRGRKADEGKWLHEIAAPKDLFSPYASMADNDKFDLLGRPENMLFAEKLRKSSPSSPEAREYSNVFANDSLIAGEGPARDALDWPELDAQYPSILDMKMEFHPKSVAMNSHTRGEYDPRANKATVFPASMTENPGDTGAPRRVLMHEMQHGVQQNFGLPTGGAPGAWDSQRQAYMMDLVNELRRLQKSGDAKTFNDAEILIQQIYPQANRTEYEQYKNLMGEAQARAVSSRDLLTSREKAASHPLEVYNNTRGLVDSDLWYAAMANLRNHKPTDVAAANLVNWLRQKHPHP